MEKVDIETEIKHYERLLKNIDNEYSNSAISDWAKIKEKEVYFIRQIYRLKKLQKQKPVENIIKANSEKMKNIIKVNTNNIKMENIISKEENIKEVDAENIKIENKEVQEKEISEEEQWEINNKLLSESYGEDEEEEVQDSSYNINQNTICISKSIDNIEAMELDAGNKKRKGYGDTSVKNKGESERAHRTPGSWPPEKDYNPYNYILGQYKYMGTKCRTFEKEIKFQNQKSDGAILNLSAHDPIDWPNIISVWKGYKISSI